MESYSEVWTLVKEYCKSKVTDTIYSLWLDPLTMISFENNKIVLLTSEFKANIVRTKFMDLLNEAFKETIGFEVEIEIVYENLPTKENKETVRKNLEENFKNYYNHELTFESFIVGPSNNLAHNAARAVAATPGEAYNPLFIYGPPGIGKTHLLKSIAHEIRKNDANTKIAFLSGDDFTNEIVENIQKNSMHAFHNKYRKADILIIDDVQFIAGKTTTQEEFFHTFNALKDDKKQIVISSDRPPKDITLLEERLKSRFESGLMVDIQPPSIETRMAIIKKKAEMLNLYLPDDVVQFIAENIKSNVRQLEGTVKKINALCTISGHEPTVIIAKKATNDIISNEQPIQVTIEKILSEVARSYGVSVDNILSKKRNANISKARQAAMYVIREITNLSMEKIGEEFGGKHHSTVIYGINEIEKDMETYSSVKSTIQSIINNINADNLNF